MNPATNGTEIKIEIDLPPDLEERTYIQFDDMVRKGRIFYDRQTEPAEVFVHKGFWVRTSLSYLSSSPCS
jgi:hypothetical protein